jgi:hypothetical protein
MKRVTVVFLVSIALACNCVGQISKIPKTDSTLYSVNLSHTKYKLWNDFLGYSYTINGHKPNDSVMENTFTIATLPEIENNFEARKAYAQSTIKGFKEKIPNEPVEEKEIEINNMRAYEICYLDKDTLKKTPFKYRVYGVIFGNDKTTIGFYGMAVSNIDKTVQEFKQIAKTIKVK